MNKLTQTLIGAVAAVLLLAGCAAETPINNLIPEAGSDGTADVHEPTTAPTPEETAVAELAEILAEAPTGPGEICDINSMYTVDCHKQHPEVAYLNGLTRNADEPLASMSDIEKITLGQEACDQLRAGATEEAVNVVEGSSSAFTNNQVVVGVAIPSFCVEFDKSGLFD